MVFFVCEGCNESLKKAQVDRHAARCRACWAVTCVDCGKTFPDDEYRSHTSCISEAEKYEKSTRAVPKTKKQGPHELELPFTARLQGTLRWMYQEGKRREERKRNERRQKSLALVLTHSNVQQDGRRQDRLPH
eukprot:scaffold1197_cov228-Pinguiococcus_pyrenoidosus.AAC.8